MSDMLKWPDILHVTHEGKTVRPDDTILRKMHADEEATMRFTFRNRSTFHTIRNIAYKTWLPQKAYVASLPQTLEPGEEAEGVITMIGPILYMLPPRKDDTKKGRKIKSGFACDIFRYIEV